MSFKETVTSPRFAHLFIEFTAKFEALAMARHIGVTLDRLVEFQIQVKDSLVPLLKEVDTLKLSSNEREEMINSGFMYYVSEYQKRPYAQKAMTKETWEFMRKPRPQNDTD